MAGVSDVAAGASAGAMIAVMSAAAVAGAARGNRAEQVIGTTRVGFGTSHAFGPIRWISFAAGLCIFSVFVVISCGTGAPVH